MDGAFVFALAVDKGVAALVAAYRDGVQPALLHKAPCQKCLSQARVAIQQQSMGQAGIQSAHPVQ